MNAYAAHIGTETVAATDATLKYRKLKSFASFKSHVHYLRYTIRTMATAAVTIYCLHNIASDRPMAMHSTWMYLCVTVTLSTALQHFVFFLFLLTQHDCYIQTNNQRLFPFSCEQYVHWVKTYLHLERSNIYKKKETTKIVSRRHARKRNFFPLRIKLAK